MTMDNHAARKAAVYEAALQLIARGVSPAAMTIQQLADTAGIGKGTVYGYFSSKEEILQGLAEYCFAREIERIRVLFADCSTLAGLEERTVAYLQDIAANRMGDYKMIAQALGTPGKCESVPACADELRDIMRTLLIRLQAAGEIDRDLFRRCRRPDRAVLYRGEKAQRRHAHAESAHDAAQNIGKIENMGTARFPAKSVLCLVLFSGRKERDLVARYLQMCYTSICIAMPIPWKR